MALRRPVARWFREVGTETARERGLYQHHPRELTAYLHTKRAQRVSQLKSQIKNLRQFFRGFESANGFNLTDISRWPLQRVKKIEAHHLYLANLQSQTYKRVIPKTKQQRRGLEDFSGQVLPEQFAFVVHVESDRDEVHVMRTGRIVISRKIAGIRAGIVVMDNYLFMTLLGWRPATWDEVIQATEEMLPMMAEGRYFILSELHDMIGVAHEKRMLLRLIQRYAMEYASKKFADTILGFRRFESRVQTDKIEGDKYYARQRRAKEKTRAYDRLRSRIARRFRR